MEHITCRFANFEKKTKFICDKMILALNKKNRTVEHTSQKHVNIFVIFTYMLISYLRYFTEK